MKIFKMATLFHIKLFFSFSFITHKDFWLAFMLLLVLRYYFFLLLGFCVRPTLFLCVHQLVSRCLVNVCCEAHNCFSWLGLGLCIVYMCVCVLCISLSLSFVRFYVKCYIDCAAEQQVYNKFCMCVCKCENILFFYLYRYNTH